MGWSCSYGAVQVHYMERRGCSLNRSILPIVMVYSKCYDNTSIHEDVNRTMLCDWSPDMVWSPDQ